MTTLCVMAAIFLMGGLGCMPYRPTATKATTGPVPTLTLPTAPLTNVKELLDKAITARGGEAALKKLSSVAYQGKGKSTPSNVVSNMTFRTTVALPDRIRDETDYDNGTKFVQVLQRSKGWVSINGSVKEMDSINLKSIQESLYVSHLLTLLPLRDARYTLEPLPEQRREGVMTVGFTVKCKDQRDVMMYFDRETSLPLLCKTRITDSNLYVEHEQEIFFTRYEAIDGLQFPRRWVIYTDGNLSMELNYETLKFIDKLDDILFAKP